MRKPAIVITSSIVLFIAFFWIFGDDFPPRISLLAGIFWGAITMAVLVALYYPSRHNGHNGNHDSDIK